MKAVSQLLLNFLLLAMLTAFNNIFSNLGYCLLGLLFLIIVLRR